MSNDIVNQLAFLSDKVYTKHKEGVSLGNGWKVLVSSDPNTTSGFAAEAYYRLTGEGKADVVIAYRGTDGFADVLNAWSQVAQDEIPQTENQLKQAKVFYESLFGEKGAINGASELRNVEVTQYFTGHSLGGVVLGRSSAFKSRNSHYPRIKKRTKVPFLEIPPFGFTSAVAGNIEITQVTGGQ